MQIKSVGVVSPDKFEGEIDDQPLEKRPKMKYGGWESMEFSSSYVFEAEERFVLVDSKTGEVLKSKTMKQSEVDEKNKVISDINYAWVKPI